MTTETLTSRAARRGGFLPIGDYGVIGDGHTTAHVGIDGSIDWLCLPTFADQSVFAAVLDPERGGRFELAPSVPYEAERRYLRGTNVLESVYSTADGRVRVTDAMNLAAVGVLPGSELVRRIECLAGTVPMRWSAQPRFDYGRARPTIERRHGVPMASHGGLRLAIRSFDAGAEQISDDAVHGEVTLREGDRALVSLVAAADSPLLFTDRDALESRLDQTVEMWRRWVSGCSYEGPWREQVERSLLAIRLAIYEPGGAMVAAPTTSLPEKIGGERNFDYRYSWVRDTTFALDAVLRMGMREEAHRSFSWLLDATSHTHPRMQPFYRLDGHPPSGQMELEELVGYRESRPVNLGNGAADQAQLGNYGDMLDTAWLYVRSGATLDAGTGMRLAQVADLVCELWPIADSGIWELGDRRDYTFSKMASWVALDRAQRLHEAGELHCAHPDRWRQTAETIMSYVLERCWSDEMKSFTRDGEHPDELDAATLLAARMGFLDPVDERITGTIDAVRRELGAGGPLLYRYTGMRGEEGAFAACSYWLAEALARAGRTDESGEAIEAMLSYASDLGLMSEEIDPDSRELLGNYPQVLTHLSFLNAAALHAETTNRH